LRRVLRPDGAEAAHPQHQRQQDVSDHENLLGIKARRCPSRRCGCGPPGPAG
jgi:hypothetical protein